MMLRFGAIAATIVVAFAALGGAQDSPPKEKDAKPNGAAARGAATRKLLAEEFEIPEDFRRADVAFPDLIKFFNDKLRFQDKPPTDVRVDRRGYTDEGPDYEDVMKTQVRVPPYAMKMSCREALEHAMSSFHGYPIAIVLKNGCVEIVPVWSAKIGYLIDQRVVADIREMPLKSAVEELGEMAGVTVLVDPRCGLERPVTVHAKNDVSFRGVLSSWADLYDLKLVVDEHRVLLMPRANYLAKLRDEAEEATLEAATAKARGIDPKTAPPPAERQSVRPMAEKK